MTHPALPGATDGHDAAHAGVIQRRRSRVTRSPSGTVLHMQNQGSCRGGVMLRVAAALTIAALNLSLTPAVAQPSAPTSNATPVASPSPNSEPVEVTSSTTSSAPQPANPAVPDDAITGPIEPSPLPQKSGTGRRVVYDISDRRVWLVNADGSLHGTWKVTGRPGKPAPGTYKVFSKSKTTRTVDGKYRFGHMVRFARAASGVAIGFHDLPYSTVTGKPIMPASKIGEPGYRSGGCVRQRPRDAEEMYRWAKIGTVVVTLN